MREIAYTTTTGHKISIQISSDFRLDQQGRRKSSGEKEVTIKVRLDGQNHFSPMGLQRLSQPQQGCVSKIGQIGLNQERTDLAEQMISDTKEEISDHNQRIEDHSRKLDSLGTGDINREFGKDC